MNLWILPAAGPEAADNFRKTLAAPVDPTTLRRMGIEPPDPCYVWGGRDTHPNFESNFANLSAGDLCLFYTRFPGKTAAQYNWIATVVQKLEDKRPDLSVALWGNAEFPSIFFLDQPRRISLTPIQLSKGFAPYRPGYLGNAPMFFMRVPPDLLKQAVHGSASVEEWLRGLGVADAIPTQQPTSIRSVIANETRQDMLEAIHDLDLESDEYPHESSTYDVLHSNIRYPPKGIVGLAARRQLGRALHPHEFEGGMGTPCFEALERCGFEIVPKVTPTDRQEPAQPRREPHPPSYTFEDATADLFMPGDEFRDIVDALRNKKNVVLQGPPGVGKTMVARRIAWTLLGSRDNARVQMVQFHPSYSYEDFVQGLRPAPQGGFHLKDGVFFEFCRKAQSDAQRPYVFIIDEINRGNLAKILGELMLLIETDKRGPEYAIPLTYSTNGGVFYVPENVYLLGLMNTADRSLALVDYALRRRFRFRELRPQFHQLAFRTHLADHGAPPSLVTKIVDRMTALNTKIEEDHRNLGRGFAIGHSFFCLSNTQVTADEAWYRSVIEGEIAPLIDEYWFDRRDTAKKWTEELLAP